MIRGLSLHPMILLLLQKIGHLKSGSLAYKRVVYSQRSLVSSG